MPPVRWKLNAVIAICLVQIIVYTDAQHMQDSISMTSDGWRPIIGTRREPLQYHEEITHYRNPSQNSETVKAETPFTQSPITLAPVSPIQTPPSPKLTQTPLPVNNINPTNRGKIPPHSKHPQYYTLPNHGSHGPHIPIGAVSLTRPGQHGQIKKYPVLNKPHLHMTMNGKRHVKPVRTQASAHSTREEIFAPAPNSGSYSFFTQGQNTIKTRETPLLNLASATNHYSVNQPHSHVEFTNRFAIPPTGENIFKQFNSPLPSFIFPKHPQTNDINYQFQNQNDEYTRNLVPPPIYKKFQEKEQTNNKPNKEPQVQVTTLPQFSKPHIPENIVVQLPPPFEQNKFNLPPRPVEQAVDVQVTKEKFKVFHNNIPPNYNGEYDYDYHSIRKPSVLPKLQTYEVTEGKPWQDTPPHISSFPEFKHRSRKPQLKRRPEIELKFTPFLPTPYKPDDGVPTSPTQSEVSTIFTHLSKLQKEKNEYNTANPSYFDVKEVSTHYPIIGRPDFATESSIAIHENPEMSNEITTNYNYNLIQTQPPAQTEQPLPTVVPIKTTTTRVPQRTRLSHRRRRPINRPRTTTTEESVVETENYELQKTQENETSESVETERPYRQKRPNRYRTSTQSVISDSEESSTKPTRGRTRHRTRLGNNERNIPVSVTYRKRIRPSNFEITELPPNHKITEDDMELMEYHQTTEAYRNKYPQQQQQQQQQSQQQIIEKIKQDIYDSSSLDDASEISEEIENFKKKHKFQYELPGRHYETTEDESQIAITDSSNPIHRYTENVEEVTIQQSKSSPTTEQLPTTNLHIPENEVDFTLIPHKQLDLEDVDIKDSEEEIILTTIPATTTIEPTTTTTTTTTSTAATTTTSATKSHRIRGRPIKYDNSNRPRFSVKDYRQRLNQYSSTSTTESYKTTSEGLKIRFPNRMRRPTSSTSTTTAAQNEDEETTDASRSKFVPKEPRHSATKDELNDAIITEKNVKAVNTRLRPFGRHRSTTTPTSTTPKISIKPNLFSRRRPPPISLRTRIYNKYNKTGTDDKSTDNKVNKEEAQTELSETIETTLPYNQNIPEEQTTTEYGIKRIRTTEPPPTDNTDSPVTDILKNESFMYSQRVSDLTSSSKNEYNTPGLFKSVAPTSRRIPNYFTIATDDPILPIEAFFPNIKDKDKEKE